MPAKLTYGASLLLVGALMNPA